MQVTAELFVAPRNSGSSWIDRLTHGDKGGKGTGQNKKPPSARRLAGEQFDSCISHL